MTKGSNDRRRYLKKRKEERIEERKKGMKTRKMRIK